MSQLALHGGTPVRTDPFPARRLFGPDEKATVVEMFDRAAAEGSHVLGYSGPEEEAYCREFAESMGGGFADGVNSGTNAVWVALRALELEPYGEVVVPAVTDPGGIMPVVLSGLIPVVADSMPGHYNVGPEQVEARLSERTRAIILAHITGHPIDLDPIMEMARHRGIPVIEDCAQAHGATYKGKPLGTFGQVAAFSTMFGKHHATAGQGGLVYTQDEALYWKVRQVADRGKPFGIDNPQGNVVASLNCNMDELGASIGRVQLKRLPEMVAIRRRHARRMQAECEARLETVRVLGDPPFGESAYWFLFFNVDVDRLTVDKDGFVEAVSAEGVPLSGTYKIIPSQYPWFTERRAIGPQGCHWPWSEAPVDVPREFDLPNAEANDRTICRILLHEGWSDREVDDTVAALEKVERALKKK
ncbi:MAG: DegT/DnrJ/EryC1/StrS family aminotransferase [Planctomycetota bacterium]